MPIESATYISDLNASNPIGATDPLSSADDHLRLLKATIKATFPSVTGAVTPTHTAINQTCVGTGGTFPAINGSALTALNATALASGTVADARLSANVPLLNAANTFSALNKFTAETRLDNVNAFLSVYNGSGVRRGYLQLNGSNIELTAEAAALVLTAATTITLNGVASTDFARLSQVNAFSAGSQRLANDSAFLAFYNTANSVRSGYLQIAAAADAILDVEVNQKLRILTNSLDRLEISAAGNFDFKAGTVTRNNASASEVGYAGSPRRDISAGDNTAATDAGKTIRYTAGGGSTFTLDGDPPTDSRVTVINSSGGNITLAASGTLTHPTIGTGSRTLNTGATVEAHHLGSGSWYIVASGGTIT